MREVEQSPDRSWTMDRRPNFLQSLLVTHASTPNLKITDLIQFRNLSILNLWLKLHILLQVFLLVMVFCACNILLKSVLEGLCHFYLKRSIQWNLRQIFIEKLIHIAVECNFTRYQNCHITQNLLNLKFK